MRRRGPRFHYRAHGVPLATGPMGRDDAHLIARGGQTYFAVGRPSHKQKCSTAKRLFDVL